MKQGLFKSFRFKILLYSLLSMFLTFMTEGVVCLIGYFIYRIMNEESTQRIQSSNSGYLNYIAGENTYGFSNSYKESAATTADSVDGSTLILLLVAGIVVAFILFTAYFLYFTKRYSTYMAHIKDGITKLSVGDFDTRIEMRYEDELTDIAKNLNKMAGDIKSVMDNERKSEEKKNELITNVAHDLRTPLTSIIGYLDLVSRQDITSETQQKYIKIAYDKSKRLEKMIEDLFSYTKYEFGEVKMYEDSMDLVKMLEQLLDEFYPSFEDNAIEYSFHTNEPAIMIEADGNMLARAFANLIGNAIKYGASGKNIVLSVTKEIKTVSVSVINYGEVIPEKELSNVFDKFYRVDTSRSEERGGSGLGLAIAKNIIELHHGSISVKSDLDGTEFKVILPLI
ncbi:MAG: HAMP domain-containing histidine kinase [Lachnospiraceae bacterium]|nr:HAMP domain-containing histidine kinase [Lachnospiraceae bacterium]